MLIGSRLIFEPDQFDGSPDLVIEMANDGGGSRLCERTERTVAAGILPGSVLPLKLEVTFAPKSSKTTGVSISTNACSSLVYI
jgi:hypothetical protein